jgi:RHS repeat-associated protein
MEVRNYQTNEMNLNYFCQRYYDPEIGRFMSLDPFGGYIEMPQSQNRYAYCINNPLKYIDPLGLDWGNDPEAYTFKNPIMLSALIATAPRYLPILEQQYLVILEKMTPIATMDSRNAGGGYDRTWNRFKWTVLQDWLRSLKSVHETIFGKGRGGKRPSWWGSSGSRGSGGGSLGPMYTQAIEFDRIISTYESFWITNFPKHYTTADPFWASIDPYAWDCVQWSDAWIKCLENLDLRYYKINRLEMPSWYAPFPYWHTWVVLTAERSVIYTDPWFFGFGVWFRIR